MLAYLIPEIAEFSHNMYTVRVKKKKKGHPFFTPNFSKSKKIYNKTDDSIIILLSFGTLFIHIRPCMAAQQSIFVKHFKIVFVQVGIVCGA